MARLVAVGSTVVNVERITHIVDRVVHTKNSGEIERLFVYFDHHHRSLQFDGDDRLSLIAFLATEIEVAPEIPKETSESLGGQS